jgi:peptide subunit release factor 1 (eRF1)
MEKHNRWTKFEEAQSIMDYIEEAYRFALVADMASEILMLADEMEDDVNLGSTEEAYPRLLEDEYLIDEVNERLVQHGLEIEDVYGQLILRRC